ncbi:MAG TPA: hypothetical protein VFZ93_03935 [Albitalea sp.]
MSLIRKTQAKYGAKIPAARSTGAKQAPTGAPAPSGDAAARAGRDARADKPTPVSTQPASHIEPSKHSTAQVDEFLDLVEGNVEGTPGAGSPAIKPNKNVDEDGKPATDTPRNPRM